MRAAAAVITFAAPAVVALTCAGCVERVMKFRTDPPGATIFVNGQERAVTTAERPLVEVPFYWYGNYEITVRKDGCFTERATYAANPPWYQFIPIDLIAESLPFTLRDEHAVPTISLRSREGVPRDEAERLMRRDALLDRAEELRQRVLP